MSCPTGDNLHAFLDKALPPTQAESVGAHVVECEACRGQVDRAARLAGVMSLSRPAPGCLSAAKLALFAAGQLEDPAKGAFLLHIGRCRRCTEALLVIRRSVTARVKTPVAQPAAAPRAARPTARIAPSRSGLGWVAAALAIASIGAGVWFAKHSTPQDQGTQVVQPTPPKPPVAAPTDTPPQEPEVVHLGPPPEGPQTPEDPDTPPEELVLDPPREPEPNPLEPDEPPDRTQPPEPPLEDHAAKPPEPAPPVEPPADPAPPRPTAPKEQPFDLAATVGSVDVQLPGKTTWQPLREGQSLKAEGRLSVKVGGSKPARVAFAGHVVSLDKNSEISVALFERDCELALSRGGALVDARKTGERTLSLDLAGGRVHAKGARFLAAVTNRQGRVVPFDGDVNVEAAGQNLAVPHGLACLLIEGKGPGEPAKADAAALLLWTRELEVFVNCEAEKGRIKDPMKARTDSGASGGRYVTSTPRERDAEPGFVEFAFDAKRAGVYRLFAKTSSGEVREAGAFAVSLDGGKPHEMRVRGRGDDWGWGGLDPVELPAGRHVVRFVDPRGGLRLDTIIVTTDTLFHPDPGAREEKGPEEGDRPPRDRGQGDDRGGRDR